MRNEDGTEFDIKPRGPSWRPDQGVPTPRMKIWLQAEAHRAREMMDPDNAGDGWACAHHQAVAVGREPFWIGK